MDITSGRRIPGTTGHQTEVSSTFVGDDALDEEEWFVWCTCGWNTQDMQLRTEEQASTAAMLHVSVRSQLETDPVNAAIAAVWKRHQEHFPIREGRVGVLECTCGAWSAAGYPAGYVTVVEQWLLHFTESMREALQPLMKSEPSAPDGRAPDF